MNDKHHESLAIHADDPDRGMDLPSRATVRRRARYAAYGVALILAAGSIRTILANVSNDHALSSSVEQNARQYVNIVTPTPADAATAAEANVTLPGTLRGYSESPVYARATGYVRRWYVDIGTHVQQGQLLAELDTPEVDQEQSQASAQRQQAESTLALAKVSLARALQLRQRDAVSQQELDDRQGAYNQDVANMSAAEANLRRLNQLESFKRIVAPFSGVITQRNIDTGDLIDAGSGTSARALFAVAQSDPLRVFVQVPQSYSNTVAAGQHVAIRQTELPDKVFDGVISDVSGAIDVGTRSLQVEVRLPNPDGVLIPGAYVQVSFPGAVQGKLILPGNTLLFRAQGPQVAVVGADNRVKLRSVVIARDFGLTLEIANGVGPTDRVVLNPADSIADGDPVTIAPAAGAGAAGNHGKSDGKSDGNSGQGGKPAAGAAA
ncbi:efflux transporter periplasmic adaptor subunit [Paraburkholderia acidicola]|uniref:Efflux transporter periplasmic adaptor subunit n=1 Tax=Paraburkholderia acidicola TaxID=1912599 RepID=A0A2A4EMR0_9BURK|nr:efflux RND transporter periplasmic adaptor subunit [Paraburkholderia acidicola]PCE22421.1 efflux transporter periplasmic adaptor subunit [Paraburkholderia acidicola]